MDLFQFVETEYGVEAAANMKNIHIGGSNNQKGSLFEQYFAICKICEIASSYQEQLSNVVVSAQEVGFVDDFCVRYNASKTKINYQAKNSAGAPADWTLEKTTKFMRQHLIDISFHKFASSSQVLLVSCP